MAVLTPSDALANSLTKQAITTTHVTETTALGTLCCHERALCWESGVWVDQAFYYRQTAKDRQFPSRL